MRPKRSRPWGQNRRRPRLPPNVDLGHQLRGNDDRSIFDVRNVSMEFSKTTRFVDSWAIIAWLLDQTGASQVQAFLEAADTGNAQIFMSWINVGEVYYMAARRLGPDKAENFF
jgi:hypothetical protein